MKRYWKIISICLVAILGVGGFYIQSSFAANENVKIVFKKIDGDENEVKDLILSGDYQTGDRARRLQITSDETSTPDRLSFLQVLKRVGVPPILEGLVNDHKSFMRSKELTANHFFEGENTVAYAQIQADNLYEQPMKELTLNIELLNKKSGDITSMELDVPEREKYSWMRVEKIQLSGNKLRIIAQSQQMDGSGEFHAYTIDTDKQKLVKDRIIASVPATENGWSDLRVVRDAESIHRDQYLLIHSEALEGNSMQDDDQSNTVFKEYAAYDIENDLSKKVTIPDEMLDSIGGDAAVYHSTIFVPVQTANGIEVSQYDIENEKWKEKLKFNLADTKEDESSYLKVMNGKLYAVSVADDGHILFIGDLETGESLYEGKLEVKNQGDEDKDYQLYIFEVLEEGRH